MSAEPITFDTGLYELGAVRATAEAFAGLASISLHEDAAAKTVTVRFDEVREDVRDAIHDEFCNHALAGTVERRRLAAA